MEFRKIFSPIFTGKVSIDAARRAMHECAKKTYALRENFPRKIEKCANFDEI